LRVVIGRSTLVTLPVISLHIIYRRVKLIPCDFLKLGGLSCWAATTCRKWPTERDFLAAATRISATVSINSERRVLDLFDADELTIGEIAERVHRAQALPAMARAGVADRS
jgi:hypothetical protein